MKISSTPDVKHIKQLLPLTPAREIINYNRFVKNSVLNVDFFNSTMIEPV